MRVSAVAKSADPNTPGEKFPVFLSWGTILLLLAIARAISPYLYSLIFAILYKYVCGTRRFKFWKEVCMYE